MRFTGAQGGMFAGGAGQVTQVTQTLTTPVMTAPGTSQGLFSYPLMLSGKQCLCKMF